MLGNYGWHVSPIRPRRRLCHGGADPADSRPSAPPPATGAEVGLPVAAVEWDSALLEHVGSRGLVYLGLARLNLIFLWSATDCRPRPRFTAIPVQTLFEEAAEDPHSRTRGNPTRPASLAAASPRRHRAGRKARSSRQSGVPDMPRQFHADNSSRCLPNPGRKTGSRALSCHCSPFSSEVCARCCDPCCALRPPHCVLSKEGKLTAAAPVRA
jgi:hypothetical protein